MRVPQARYPLFDCDVHQRLGSPKDLRKYLPRVYQEELDQFGLHMPGPGFPNGGDRGYRADAWPKDGSMVGSDYELMRAQLLDAYDVRYAILLGQELRPLSTLPDADYAAAIATAANDLVIEQWLARDSRLLGSILVATQYPQRAAQEIRRVGERRDMVEILLSDGAPMPYGKRYYDPIYQACVDLKLPVAIHTGSEGPSPVGLGSYYVENRQTRPMGYMAHIASMVFEGLFERFPTLNVVFIEGGYVWLPTYLWRLDSDWRALRHQTPWVKRPPSEYIFEHCKFTSQPIETVDKPEKLLTVFEWAQAERTLMFASDYPHWDFDSPLQALPPMPDPLRRRIMYETASELYRLPVTEPAQPAAGGS